MSPISDGWYVRMQRPASSAHQDTPMGQKRPTHDQLLPPPSRQYSQQALPDQQVVHLYQLVLCENELLLVFPLVLSLLDWIEEFISRARIRARYAGSRRDALYSTNVQRVKQPVLLQA